MRQKIQKRCAEVSVSSKMFAHLCLVWYGRGENRQKPTLIRLPEKSKPFRISLIYAHNRGSQELANSQVEYHKIPFY